MRLSELPLPPNASDDIKFRNDLLDFACTNEKWQILCGGIHMLDFLVREPDLYASVLSNDWRDWLKDVDIMDLIDLLNREDLSRFSQEYSSTLNKDEGWRSYRFPPTSLITYISTVRSFMFNRSFRGARDRPQASELKLLNRQLVHGMNPKKLHEVNNFSAFVNDLRNELSAQTGHRITDVVDFGAGQGYLGRVLASPLYGIDVASVESKPHNINGARKGDVIAKLSKQEVIYRNKKLYRSGMDPEELARMERQHAKVALLEDTDRGTSVLQNCGTIRHIEHQIIGGDLTYVVDKLHYAKNTLSDDSNDDSLAQSDALKLMVVSLHSCGNLLHHGLRSLTLNDSVKAVAMIGCCYNLCTERIGGPSFKLPNLRLRAQNKRLIETSNASDADGFPMSEHFLSYKYEKGTGIKLNITARMMAVQAPRNWTKSECDNFFTRHWYRALLQRILLDHGIVKPFCVRDPTEVSTTDAGGEVNPITIGKLPKLCFTSFIHYVRGALSKLVKEEDRGDLFRQLNDNLVDEDIAAYETLYASRRHDLCILWSFMAFSAGVVETLIILDRWQWLREQKEVWRAWVQPVFDYSLSPRNLVIVGLKA